MQLVQPTSRRISSMPSSMGTDSAVARLTSSMRMAAPHLALSTSPARYLLLKLPSQRRWGFSLHRLQSVSRHPRFLHFQLCQACSCGDQELVQEAQHSLGSLAGRYTATASAQPARTRCAGSHPCSTLQTCSWRERFQLLPADTHTGCSATHQQAVSSRRAGDAQAVVAEHQLQGRRVHLLLGRGRPRAVVVEVLHEGLLQERGRHIEAACQARAAADGEQAAPHEGLHGSRRGVQPCCNCQTGMPGGLASPIRAQARQDQLGLADLHRAAGHER